MPTVQGGGQITQRGQHRREQIDRKAKPRSELREAFAGDENIAKDPKAITQHSTSVKSRKTKASRYLEHKV